MSDSEKIVYVVDDHPLYRSGFIRHLHDYADFDVREFDSISSAHSALKEVLPAIVFLDLELPDGSGLSAINDYLGLTPVPRIVLLTTHQDSSYIERAQQLGAHAYLLKDDHPDVVYRCLDHLEVSTEFFLSERTSQIVQAHSQSDSLSSKNMDVSTLTMREKEILFFLAKDLTSKEIAKQMGLSFRTVQNHRANIKSRLMLERNSQLIKVANASHVILNKLFSSHD